MQIMGPHKYKCFRSVIYICVLKFVFIFSLIIPNQVLSQELPQSIKLKVSENFESDALLYESKGKLALVLVHQSGYRKESWDELARNFQLKGITSLSLERSDVENIQAAVKYLIDRKHNKLALIGASIGGGAVLQTLQQGTPTQIQAVILLAPSYGPPLENNNIRKLVIVTANDKYGRYANDVYKEASHPKKLVEFSGSKHAQELFKSSHRDKVTNLILDFLIQK